MDSFQLIMFQSDSVDLEVAIVEACYVADAVELIVMCLNSSTKIAVQERMGYCSVQAPFHPGAVLALFHHS